MDEKLVVHTWEGKVLLDVKEIPVKSPIFLTPPCPIPVNIYHCIMVG